MKQQVEKINFALKGIDDDTVETVVIPSVLKRIDSKYHENKEEEAKLFRLDLSCNGITAVGLAILIKEILSLEDVSQSIVSLDLSANKLRDEGIILLSEFLETNTTLRHVDIHANRVTDKGAEAFGNALLNNHSLEAFDISANDISEEGEASLDKCAQMNRKIKSLTGQNRMETFDEICNIS